MKIGLIVGSLRKESWNRKVAEVVKTLFSDGVEADFIEIKDLPFYNEDLDQEGEELLAFVNIRKEIKAYDGYIFFTPEYNRSYAPAIKNVLDIGSRGKDGNLWAKKPASVISASTGGMGGMAGNHALRQVFVAVDLIGLQKPELYLAKVNKLFDQDGNMVEGTKDFLKKGMGAFEDFAKKIIG